MGIDNFNWDSENRIVSWTYNGNPIREQFNNAYFASLDEQENYVIVEAGQNYAQDQVYYLAYDGKQIFKMDKANEKISWQFDDRKVEVSCKDILLAQFYINQSVVITISEENKEKVLKGYAQDGTLRFVKHPPQGFSFNYLSTYKDQPSVVCDGDQEEGDMYGRTSWHFVIDKKTGELSKGNLSY